LTRLGRRNEKSETTHRRRVGGAIDRLAAGSLDDVVIRDVMLLRLRALLARARGEKATYSDLVDRYRVMVRSLGFEGHMAWAEPITCPTPPWQHTRARSDRLGTQANSASWTECRRSPVKFE
jgi:hypothetical protein